MKKGIGRLHVITEGGDGSRPYRTHAELARMAIRGGADTIQFRSKDASMRVLIEQAAAVGEVCRESGVLFLVNDRVDLCLAVNADGVHLGADDMPVEIARRILGDSAVIGATIRGIEGLRAAETASADYVGLGPVFRTTSKSLPVEPLGLETVRRVAAEASIPVIGIAGIGVENASEVAAAGAHGIAVIGAVSRASDPETAARDLLASLDRGTPRRTT